MVPPVGMDPDHDGNGITAQGDLFLYKARETKSAPARTETYVDGDKSETSSPAKRRRARLHFSWGKFINFFAGHAPEFTNWTSYSGYSSRTKFYTLFFIEASLRSIGDICFCSNPFSGLLILIGMLISCPKVAFLASLNLFAGILTAVLFLKIPLNEVRSGGVTFNNYLAGTVVALIADEDVLFKSPDIIVVSMVMGILTVIIWMGLNGLTASRLEFPLLNAPFHVMLVLYLLSGMASIYKPEDVFQIQGISESPLALNTSLGDEQMNNITRSFNLQETETNLIETTTTLPSALNLRDESLSPLVVEQSVDWEKVLCGIFLAPSQVFGTGNLMTSLLVYIGIFVYSPIMLMQSLTGATIGCLIGVGLSSSLEYEAVYSGSWAYNPLFTSAALGGFFLIFDVRSWLLSIVGSIVTTLTYSAMYKCNAPVLGIPFMVITWLLLPGIPAPEDAFQQDTQKFIQRGPFYRLRLGNITTPEQHRKFIVGGESHVVTEKYKSDQETLPNAQSVNSILPL
ncbi:Urea transporter 1 [Orchesella cincta]|uniref:Urea transporter 1 n=1 Tax=Orchesella cincta TaxID=48709 RepID=A0A1D2MQ38_ORCCI|nr:Urea transporter 1 [Orchesella cincta]